MKLKCDNTTAFKVWYPQAKKVVPKNSFILKKRLYLLVLFELLHCLGNFPPITHVLEVAILLDIRKKFIDLIEPTLVHVFPHIIRGEN